jgi:lysozyme
MKLSPSGIAVAHYFESCTLDAYPDPGSKDGTPWTNGWGHTGPEIVKGHRYTQAEADDVFVSDIAKFERSVTGLVKVPLTQGQFDALVLFQYNTGGLGTSTLLQIVNAGRYADAPAQFARWNKNDGKVMRGLIRRRAAEAALWAGNSGTDAIRIGVAAA